MPTSNAEELGLFLKCTVIGHGVFGPCTCCFDPRISSVEFQCASHYIMEPSVISITFKGTLVTPTTRYTPLVQAHPPDQVHPPEQSMLGDMVNVRAVPILLECNLVYHYFCSQLKRKNWNNLRKREMFIIYQYFCNYFNTG